MDSKASPAVHLCTLSPWRDAVDSYFADDRKAAQANPVYDMPAQYSAGDLVVFVVPARESAILHIEVLTTGSDSADLDFEDTAGAYLRGVSVRAVERRLDEALPIAPATLDHDLGPRLIDAIEAELAAATPWYVTDASGCAAGLALDVSDDRYLLHGSPWICSCCECDYRDQLFHAGLNALTWHKPLPAECDEPNPFNESIIRVCASCHAILHSPFGPSPLELLYGWREACPECGTHRTDKVMWGMPAGPPPPGVTLAGCALPEDPADMNEFECGECGHMWGHVRRGHAE